MFTQILRPSNLCCWISVPTHALNSRLILFYSVAFFLYEKCLYRDASCAKRCHLILPVNWNLCLGPKYAGWDSLSNGMLLSFNQATTMVLFSWSWHMTWFLVWCRINRPWIHSEIPNGGWTEKCWMWWRGYGRVVVTMQAWSIEEMWELEISLK